MVRHCLERRRRALYTLDSLSAVYDGVQALLVPSAHGIKGRGEPPWIEEKERYPLYHVLVAQLTRSSRGGEESIRS